MKHVALAVALMLTPLPLVALTKGQVIQGVVDTHILPRFDVLKLQSHALAETSQTECTPTSPELRAAYHNAFDAWISASHLRFGPTEVDDRAFALAFWPDSRATTPRTLGALMSTQDPIARSTESYRDVSIAARGLYALEFLLFDDTLMSAGPAAYHCALIQTISADIAATSGAIFDAWQSGYATTLLSPTPDGVYRSEDEVLQELFKSLSTGLEFTSDTRLGRPLGTFDKPRAARAEARRSGRSQMNVALSLASLQDLATQLAAPDADLVTAIDNAFDNAQQRLAALDDPTFAGVAEPQSRLRIEVVQQSVDVIRTLVRDKLGPALGVAAGFNALDGD